MNVIECLHEKIEEIVDIENKGTIHRVLVCDQLPRADLESLENQGFQIDFQPSISAEQLLEVVNNYQVLVVRSRTKVTGQVLKQGKNLEMVVRAGVGFDNIDVADATNRNVLVANTPEGNTNAAAELTIGLLFAVARHIPQADSEVRRGEFTSVKHVGVELRGKTIGVIGFGHVGQEVAQKSQALGMKAIACDVKSSRERAQNLGVELVCLDELLRRSDVISVHVPLLPTTYHLINRDTLTLVKPSAILINAARGGIVDEYAVVEALDEVRLTGAGFDVYEGEPAVNPVLKKHPKVVLTPHLGASTYEAQQAVAKEAAEQILAAYDGKVIPGAINFRKHPRFI